MKNKFCSICVFILLLMPHFVFAQFNIAKVIQPNFMLGGSVSQFRITLADFENVYDGRWGPGYGGFAGVRVFSAHYIVLKYGTFQRDGKNGTHESSGLDLKNAHWDEKWYNIGLRVHPPIANKVQSYYGFGLSFFDVNEVEGLSVFNSSSNNDGLGSGFYMELGLEYFPATRVAAFFEVQVASGGVRGKTGFEAMSVGGFRFALGISIYPF
ncbi:MAG: porin family protein [Calditrichaeota bacterium]|nr:porin family protein [Calditrichota bacterium]